MKKQILSLIIGLVAIMSIHAQVSEAKNALDHADKHFFTENKGQWPAEVLYLARIGGLDAWITKNGVLYDFYKLEEVPDIEKKKKPYPTNSNRKTIQNSDIKFGINYRETIILYIQKAKKKKPDITITLLAMTHANMPPMLACTRKP